MKSIFTLLFFFIFSIGFTQVSAIDLQIEKVDFKTAKAEISVFPEKASVEGEVEFEFDVLERTDSVYINAENMEFTEVNLNGIPVQFHNDQKKLWLISNFQASEGNILKLSYSAKPQQAMYFINWEFPEEKDVTRQVWTQGQGKNNSHWLPGFHDMREKLVFYLTFNFRKGYEVVSNGVLKEKRVLNDSIDQWQYQMQQPMSSYLVAFVAGEYKVEERTSATGDSIFLYYKPEDAGKTEPTYKFTEKIFNFLETETGVPYPWQNYKQVPVQDFLYSGMENTGVTIFSDALMVDPIAYNDHNYINVNAHELAHHWFGNFVTATTGEHHWLHEGFATYYALLAEREIFGEDYYYWRLFESAEQLKTMSDQGKGESLLSPSAGSLTYYQKGAWALHILKEKVGEEAFKSAVRTFLQKYAYGNVTTDDFLAEMEEASGMDLSAFKKNWLEQTAFQSTEALNSLKASSFIRNYMEIAALREVPLQNKAEVLERALDFPVNDYIGQEVVFQLAGNNHPQSIELYSKAFKSGNIYVRQAIALSLENIPDALKTDFISLLREDSYLTIENALLKLYMNYPGEATRWIKSTEGIEGFSNKNVRMLWLVINLVTPGLDKELSRKYFEELSGYTATHYPFEVRENAFGYLYQINAFREQNLKDLIKGAQHHTYRFRDFSRKLLSRLLESEEYMGELNALMNKLSSEDQKFLQSRLKS